MLKKVLELIDQHLKELTTGEAGPDPVHSGRVAMEDLQIEIKDMFEEMTNWDRDDYQFPRLLAEILAVTHDKLDYDALCESMDLEPAHIHELFDRADVAWERVKEETCR
jgi:hypothetical protein